MAAIYEEAGVRFAYPENWKVERSQDDEALLQITVASEATAFWALSVYPGRRDPRAIADEVLQAMQAEYPALEHDPADSTVSGAPVVGYDLSFYCLDLTNTAQVRVMHHLHTTCLVLAQAEDGEYEEAEGVFDAMTLSLLKPELAD